MKNLVYTEVYRTANLQLAGIVFYDRDDLPGISSSDSTCSTSIPSSMLMRMQG